MINKKTGMMLLLASFAAGEVRAGNLNSYASGDVLICFRKPGANDLVVDAGPIATLTNAAPNQRITISQYTGNQLALVGTNAVSWSAFTWQTDDTLFITKPRLAASLNTQTIPWQSKTSANQHNTAVRMSTIPVGAKDNLAFDPVNTVTAVVEEDNSVSNPNYPNGVSYRDSIFGSGGAANFYTTFQGVPENTTLNNFTTAGNVVRSDFYRLTPTGGFALGQFLGYFELNTNGVMSYVAYPTATPTVPTITSISRAGTTTTIGYTTGVSGTYTLRGTNSAGLSSPRINWPAISVLTSGDNLVHTVNDTSSADETFYSITGQ